MKKLLLALLLLPSAYFAQNKVMNPVEEVSFFFDYAKWNVKPSAADIGKLKKAFFTSENAVVQIVGFTDTLGTTDDNRLLAERRLNRVEKLLNEKGIKVGEKVITGEFSEPGKPLSYNRRVDVIVMVPGKEEYSNPVIPEEESIEVIPAEPSPEKPWELQLNVPIVLQIEFQNGTAILMPYSYSEVDKLFFILSDHPDYNIQLHGHVCCSDSYQTSLDRASTVKGELIRKGIAAERITVYGHSNTKPLFAEVDEESKQRNRRVEAVFIEE